MKKIGTHNSLTYHAPQWWLRWLNFTAKCQNLTIREQYKVGVRRFDFRIRFTRHGIRSGHGIMTYKVDFCDLFSFLNGKGDCYVYLMLENHVWEKDIKDQQFITYVEHLIHHYPSVRFIGGDRKRPGANIVPLDTVPVIACFQCFEGKSMKFPYIPYPYWYARKNNKEYWKRLNDEAYCLFDFVEIK